MRDALATFKAKNSRGKSFRAPAAPESLSLCVAKEKVTKEKGHPAWRLLGILPNKSVSRGRAFRAGIVPARKGVAILGNARCAACRPRLTAAQGTPGGAAGHRGPHSVMELKSRSHSKASLCCGFVWAFDLALLKSARRMRAALPGAPLQRRAGGGKARRVAGMDAGQFVVRAGCPVDKPRSPTANLAGRMPARRVSGVAFLLGYFLFGHAKRK